MSIGEVFTSCVGILAVLAVAALPVACTMNRQAQIAEAIKGGADPIAVKCAIEGETDNSKLCLVYAASKGELLK